MLNKAILMGRITRDPELKYTQSNVPVVSFTLAVDRGYRSRNNEQQPTADFINCVAWRQTAEFISKWFTKGKMMIVIGSIQTRRYQDKNGENRYVTEVLVDEVSFGEARRAEEEGGRFAPSPQGGYQSQESTPFGRQYDQPPSDNGRVSDFTELEDDDDELPF